jgi:CRISPR-associated exonuclease Cas4
MDYEIAIRSIQHYLYCPHRWGLLEIGNVWAENAFVVKGNLMHERVHNPDSNYSSRDKKVFTAVSVYNDLPEYGIYGVTDCIEAKISDCGINIPGETEKYSLCIVEYKPTKPKDADFNPDDAMQIFAQKICVDYIFKTDCKAAVYYADVKKRVILPFNEEYVDYDYKLKNVLYDMRKSFESGIIPEIRKNQKCSGCSMKDLCLPKANRVSRFREEIIEISGDEK